MERKIENEPKEWADLRESVCRLIDVAVEKKDSLKNIKIADAGYHGKQAENKLQQAKEEPADD